MGDPNYEARRKEQADRQLAEERRARVRVEAEAIAESVGLMAMLALRDWLDGKAHLQIGIGAGQKTEVRFVRDPVPVSEVPAQT